MNAPTIIATLNAGTDAENSFPPGDVLPAPTAPMGNGPAIPPQGNPPTEETADAKRVNSHDFSKFDPQHQLAENRPSNRIFEGGAAGESVDGMPWPAMWGDSEKWSAADREALQERAGIREFDGGMTRADAEREAVGDVHPTAPPGGLIDALAADGLLHPRGAVTTTADGRRVWQHPDFDGAACAAAMRDRTAPASVKWDAESGQFATNRDTDRAGEKGGGE